MVGEVSHSLDPEVILRTHQEPGDAHLAQSGIGNGLHVGSGAPHGVADVRPVQFRENLFNAGGGVPDGVQMVVDSVSVQVFPFLGPVPFVGIGGVDRIGSGGCGIDVVKIPGSSGNGRFPDGYGQEALLLGPSLVGVILQGIRYSHGAAHGVAVGLLNAESGAVIVHEGAEVKDDALADVDRVRMEGGAPSGSQGHAGFNGDVPAVHGTVSRDFQNALVHSEG